MFEKDSKLCLTTNNLLILQEYLQEINSTPQLNKKDITENKITKKNSSIFNSTDFIALYKSNHLHLIQDFLYKITNLKIVSETCVMREEDIIDLNIFGSITFLEIKNVPIRRICNMQYLRNQLEVLICNRTLNSLYDLLYLCGRDNCNYPVMWHKLNTLNLSYNQLRLLDNSFVSDILTLFFGSFTMN